MVPEAFRKWFEALEQPMEHSLQRLPWRRRMIIDENSLAARRDPREKRIDDGVLPLIGDFVK